MKESRYNQFLLLQIQAKDKSYQDITSDTVIFKVKDYYSKKNAYPKAVDISDYFRSVSCQGKNIPA